MALVLALAGRRWSEIAALDERDVARDDGRLFLSIRRRHVLDEKGKRVTLPGTKGGRSVTRMVPLLPELVPIVERHLTGHPQKPCSRPREGRGWTRGTGDATAGGRKRASSSTGLGCAHMTFGIPPPRHGCG